MPFISLSCLIALARTSSTTLTKVLRADILTLFTILGERVFFLVGMSMVRDLFLFIYSRIGIENVEMIFLCLLR